MVLPKTVYNPEKFLQSPSLNNDGVWDWSPIINCFPGAITPMDFDGVIERRGNFLIFETKNMDVDVPQGQVITFKKLYQKGGITVVFIEGKDVCEKMKVWCQSGFNDGKIMEAFAVSSTERLQQFCRNWYAYADANPCHPVNIDLLNRRIYKLEEETMQYRIELANVRHELEVVVQNLGGVVTWPTKVIS